MIKVSNKTPILVILFIIVSIAGMIYSPWTDIYDTIYGDDAFIAKFIFTVICPTMGEMCDVVECIQPFFDGLSKGSNMQYALAMTLKIPVYVIVVHMIEKYHAEMHITEEIYTICINIHCVEGISMYLLNITFHILGKIFEASSQNDDLFFILFIIFGVFTLCFILFMLTYILGGMLATLLLPVLLSLLFDSLLGNIGMTIGFIVGIIIGRIIWSIISDWFYNWLLNLRIFKIPNAILSFFNFDFDLFI